MRDCCLVVFTKPAHAGTVKTRLIGELTPEQAATLHEAFLEDLLERFAEAPYDVRIAWAVQPEEALPGRSKRDLRQSGDGLGERLFNGLSAAARRSRCVAAVGSDHPLLSVARVSEAFEQLQTADVVVGPASDGGYYLVALHRETLSRDLFRDIDWSTERVLAQTLERCRAGGLTAHLLATESDVDTASDLHWLRIELERDQSLCPRSRGLLDAWYGVSHGVGIS